MICRRCYIVNTTRRGLCSLCRENLRVDRMGDIAPHFYRPGMDIRRLRLQLYTGRYSGRFAYGGVRAWLGS